MEELAVSGLKTVPLASRFSDFRGHYWELYSDTSIAGELPGGVRFRQHCVSRSERSVLRGFHGDEGTHKLIFCLHGTVQTGFYDNRQQSLTYKQSESVVLDAGSPFGLFVPAGVGNAFLTLSDYSLYFYAQSTLYGEFEQFTIPWNVAGLSFSWQIENPVLSERDSVAALASG